MPSRRLASSSTTRIRTRPLCHLAVYKADVREGPYATLTADVRRAAHRLAMHDRHVPPYTSASLALGVAASLALFVAPDPSCAAIA